MKKEPVINEINKVQLLIRRFLYETKDVVLDAEESQKWLKGFRDTLHYQELMESPNQYALDLLNEARSYSEAQRERIKNRWKAKKEKEESSTSKKSPQRSDVTTGKPEANKSGSPTTAFGEYGNVTMSKDEETKLRNKLGLDFERAVEILANYKKSTGKSYKSDYGAINNWVVRRLQEEKAKGADPKAPRNMAEYYDRMIDKYFPEDFDDGQFRSNDT